MNCSSKHTYIVRINLLNNTQYTKFGKMLGYRQVMNKSTYTGGAQLDNMSCFYEKIKTLIFESSTVHRSTPKLD